MEKTKRINFSNLITIITSAVSLIMSVVYVTWFAASIDKRVTLLEQHDGDFQEQMKDLVNTIQQTNQQQDNDRDRFRGDTTSRLSNLDDKIDKIYSIIIDNDKDEKK